MHKFVYWWTTAKRIFYWNQPDSKVFHCILQIMWQNAFMISLPLLIQGYTWCDWVVDLCNALVPRGELERAVYDYKRRMCVSSQRKVKCEAFSLYKCHVKTHLMLYVFFFISVEDALLCAYIKLTSWTIILLIGRQLRHHWP